MKIYHGSLVSVENPKILPRENGKTCDFGIGFYTTTNYEQAKKWVSTKITQSKGLSEYGFVSVYEIPDNLLSNKSFTILIFEKASEEWLNFVIKNRKNPNYDHGYDLVYGPVANDRVYTTINLYETGLLSMETAINELKTYKLADQILFHTEKSLSVLKYISTEKI